MLTILKTTEQLCGLLSSTVNIFLLAKFTAQGRPCKLLSQVATGLHRLHSTCKAGHRICLLPWLSYLRLISALSPSLMKTVAKIVDSSNAAILPGANVLLPSSSFCRPDCVHLLQCREVVPGRDARLAVVSFLGSSFASAGSRVEFPVRLCSHRIS